MEWEDIVSPLGDPPASLDYFYTPWGIEEPPSPSTIYIPPHPVLQTSNSAPQIDDTLPILTSPGPLEKLNFAYEPHKNDFGPIRQSRKDIAIFGCGCWRLDRSKWRGVSEYDPTNVTRDSKSIAYSGPSVEYKLIEPLGLCELRSARARHQAKKDSEVDEIIRTKKPDKYGDHIHLTMCIRIGTQPHRQASSLANSIAQSEVRKAINQDEYLKTSNGKAMDLAMDMLHHMESSSVQQSPVISRLHDVMLPNYTADLDDLNNSMRTQNGSDRGTPERTSHGPDSAMSAYPEKKSIVPKRQSIKANAISKSDLSKRTEEDWEYMSSREERYVTLVPLLDACKACKKEKKGKRGKTTRRRATKATKATNDPESDGGSLEITEQMQENAPCLQATEASKATEPDDGIFLEFTKQTRQNTPCLRTREESNAPETDGRLFDQTNEDHLGVPETRDAQTLQRDGVSLERMGEKSHGMQVREGSDAPEPDIQFFDQASEENLDAPETRDTQPLQRDGVVFEQTGEKTPGMQVGEGSNASEPDMQPHNQRSENDLGAPETRDTQSHQDGGALSEQSRGNTPGMQVIEGKNAMEADTHVPEQPTEDTPFRQARQGTNDMQLYRKFLDQIKETTPRIQEREEGDTSEPYVDILRRCPFTEKIELRPMNEDFATREPVVQANRRAKRSLARFKSRQGTNTIQYNRKFPEQTTPGIQVRKGIDAPEPYVDILRRCPFSGKIELRPMNEIFATREPMAQVNRQAKPSLASFVDRIDLLKLPPGIYPRKPATETKVARQTPLPPRGFAERVDSLQLPDGAYLQKYSTKAPKPAQSPIGGHSAPTLTPANPTDSDQQPVSMAAGQEGAQPQDPPSQEVISWSSAEARRVLIPLETESGGDSQPEHSSTHDVRPSHRTVNLGQQRSRDTLGEGEPQFNKAPTQKSMPSSSTGVSRHLWPSEFHRDRESALKVPPSQNFRPLNLTGHHPQQGSPELGIDGNLALEGPPTQDFRSLDLTGAPHHQRSSEVGIEGNLGLEGPPTQDSRPSDLTWARRRQQPSNQSRQGGGQSNGRRRKDFEPDDLSGARQPQLSINWHIYPQWTGHFSQDMTPFNPVEDRRQQRSSEAGRESYPRLEHPPLQDFRPPYPTEVRRQQRSLETGGENKPQWEDSLSRAVRSPQPTGVLPQQPPPTTREEDEPRLREPPRQDFRPSHLTGGNRRRLPSGTGAYGRDLPPGPPVQAFPPPNLQRVPRQKGNTGDISGPQPQPRGQFTHFFPLSRLQKEPSQRNYSGDISGQLQPQPQPKGPPSQSFPLPKFQKGPRQREYSGDISGQLQPQPQPKGPPSQSFPLPQVQKGPRQREYSGDTGLQIQTPLSGQPTEFIPAPKRQQDHRQVEMRADKDERLVPFFTRPSVPSFPPPRLQKEADVRGPLKETSKQGKAPPVSRPESHRYEPSSTSRDNKRSRKDDEDLGRIDRFF